MSPIEMRLLNSQTSTLRLKSFYGKDIPSYAILSHTWSSDLEEEVLLVDIERGTLKSKRGFEKIKKCCEQAAKDQFEWIWIDTCCIDKSSSAELTESINFMYQWYKEANICYACLADVKTEKWDSRFERDFRECRWFTRGWTLQELVAPKAVQFYNSKWISIGSKSRYNRLISRVTGIDIRVLEGAEPSICNIAQRMSWARKRDNTGRRQSVQSSRSIWCQHAHGLRRKRKRIRTAPGRGIKNHRRLFDFRLA